MSLYSVERLLIMARVCKRLKQQFKLVGELKWLDVCNTLLGHDPICPRCNTQINIYSDRVYGIRWFCCHSCWWGDDVVSVIARVRKTSIAAAVDWLESEKMFKSSLTTQDKENYLLGRAERLKLADIWAKCQLGQGGADIVDVVPLLRKLKTKALPTDAIWSETLIQRLGFVSQPWLESNLTGRNSESPALSMLISPVERVPGLITGFATIGPCGIKWYNSDGVVREDREPAGWLGLRSKSNKGKWFIGEDEVAIQQWLQVENGLIPSPRTAEDEDSWLLLSSFNYGELLTLGPPSVNAVQIARLTNKPLSVFNAFGRTMATRTWLEWIDRCYLQKPRTVATWDLSHADIELARKLGLERLVRKIESEPPSAVTSLGLLESRQDGWYLNEQLISDVKIELDCEEHYADRTPVYVGRLITNHGILPFRTRALTLKKINRLLQEAHQPEAKVVTRYRRKLLTFARALRKPKVIDIVRREGWNEKERSWVFSGIRIKNGVASQASPIERLRPVPDLEASETIGKAVVALKSKGIGYLLEYLVEMIFARKAGKSIKGLVVITSPRSGLSKILEAMGCRSSTKNMIAETRDEATVSAAVARLFRIEKRISIPMLVRSTTEGLASYPRLVRSLWAKQERYHYAVIIAGTESLSSQYWATIDMRRFEDDLSHDYDAYRCLLPAFLVWYERQDPFRFETVSQAVAEWRQKYIFYSL